MFSQDVWIGGIESDISTVILTEYPVTYRVWRPPIIDGRPRRSFETASQFRADAAFVDLLATPVPGTDAGEWLKGTPADHATWTGIFGPAEPAYRARKGITTDRNGIFFVAISEIAEDGRTCLIRNDPTVGRTRGLPTVSMPVEMEHLFPLLRGEGVTAFRATPDTRHRVLVPQRQMHGDPDLPVSAPLTYRFLARFEDELKRRSSLRRYQRGQVFWSLWSTGPYTFASYKVLWREMGGGRFAAAYIGPFADALLGSRIVVPDHKLYFIPCSEEREAAYLTALLNAPLIANAVSSYAAQLSLGASVAEYLKLPKFVTADDRHRQLADLAIIITRRGGGATAVEFDRLDTLARDLFGVDAARPA